MSFAQNALPFDLRLEPDFNAEAISKKSNSLRITTFLHLVVKVTHMYTDGKISLAPDLEAAMAVLEDPTIAYVKSIIVDGDPAYGVYAADGTELAILADREVAFAAALSHDYTPVSVH